MRRKNRLSFLLALILSESSIGMNYPIHVAVQAADTVETLSGDVNADGTVSIADAVMLQKWLINSSTELTNWKNADLSQDNVVNTVDFTLLKRKLILGANPSLYAGIVINEVCTSNKTSLKDSNGKSPDWIEIYNKSSKDMDISGVGISEGNKKRYKFQFPENTVIEAGGYILVACDKDLLTEEMEYVAPFNLSASGETVYLTAPLLSDGSNGADIDIVTVPELATDVTYGRFKNGSDVFDFLSPSPNAENSETQADFVESPLFSKEAGFYEDAFELTLSSVQSETIYYTTDGSDPTSSKTAKLYSAPIKIYDNTNDANVLSARTDITIESYYPNERPGYQAPSYKVEKGMVIRAVCKNSSGNFGKVVTNGYYINKNYIGNSYSKYSDMKVISVSTDTDNLFDKDNGIYVVGNDYKYTNWKYANDARHNTNYNWGKTSALPTEQIEKPCNIQVFENGKLAFSQDVGMRISGNYSRGFAQKSLKFYARKEYGKGKMEYEFIDGLTDINGNPITSFDKITLHNGGSDYPWLHYRDEAVNKMISGMDSITPLSSEGCAVFIDGEFWGFYFIRERRGESFISEHYGIDKDDVLYINTPENNESVASDLKDIINFAYENDLSVDANYQKVCNKIDIDSLIDYISVETYVCNADWSGNSTPGEYPFYWNWDMWRTKTTDPSQDYYDGKWRYVIYDLDQSSGAWGNDDTVTTSYKYDHLGNICSDKLWYNSCQLFNELLANDTFRNKFYNRYNEIIDTYFEPSRASQILSEYDSKWSFLIKETKRRFTNAGYYYDYHWNLITDFFKNRPSYAKQYLTNKVNRYGGVQGAETVVNRLMNTANWHFYTTQGAVASGSFPSVQDQKIVCTQIGTSAHSVSANYEDLGLVQGKKYQLRFTASCSSGNGKILVFIGDHVTYEQYILETIDVTSTPQTFTFCTDTLPVIKNPNYLSFQYGIETGNYLVSDISVSEIA